MKALLFFLLGFSNPAWSWEITRGNLIEDFTDSSHWDASTSTGLWNFVDHAIQAGRVTGGVSTRPINFGDGSDGDLNSSTGYIFNTDTHPNGYNFNSISITGGTIQVQGSSPLILRSLSTVTLSSTLSVKGGDGLSGTANGSTTGPNGGTAVAGQCSGGKGGNAVSPTPGSGVAGLTSLGTLDTGTVGTGFNGAGNANSAGFAVDSQGADNTWENTSSPSPFRCGAGAAGGGGHTNGANYATGGSGGAGGGTIRIIAVGNVTYSSLDARGGNGGVGANDGNCSGSGSGGNGGAIWIQSLHSVTGGTLVLTAGNFAQCGASSSQAGIDGLSRIDSELTSTAGSFSTGNVAANQTYVIQSKAYDLGTQNAGFFSTPTLTTTLNGGSVSISYLGSSDGTTYTSTSDISTLTNRNIRYLKFRISLTTASSVGTSPQVTQIQIPFSELNIRLSGGCGTIQSKSYQNNFWSLLLGLILLTFALKLIKKVPY